MARTTVSSEVTGSVWKVEKAVGDEVAAGEVIMILESMKMEIPVEAPAKGKLVELMVAPDEAVEEDQALCVIET